MYSLSETALGNYVAIIGILYRIPIIRSFIQKLDFSRCQQYWRKTNKHNKTIANCIFSMDCYLKDLAPESLMQHLEQLYTPLQTAEQAAQLIALLKKISNLYFLDFVFSLYCCSFVLK